MCYLKHQYIIETSYNLITDNLHSQYSLQRRQFYNTVTATLFLHLWCHLQFYVCDILWPLSIFAISHGLKIWNPWKYSSSEFVDGMKRNLNKKNLSDNHLPIMSPITQCNCQKCYQYCWKQWAPWSVVRDCGLSRAYFFFCHRTRPAFQTN